jgi:pimeloyl-ACP methyl ester carboxylesterase
MRAGRVGARTVSARRLTAPMAAALAVTALVLSACTSGSHRASPSPASSGSVASTAPSGSASAPVSSLASSASEPASPAASSALASLAVPGIAPTPAQLPHIDDATLRAFTTQTLTWRSCAGGVQCSSLTVPLDYAQPSGQTISLAVVRRQTTSKNRIGSVVLNPGGPGASGVDYAKAAAPLVSAVLGGAFDVVSFDPRGVGASAPIKCLTATQLDAWVAFEADPKSATEVAQQDALAKGFAAGCAAKSGALLTHVSTVDTARDLDILRAALHDDTLTYIGASYGTFLGAIYAQLFPTHVRALVLDGALDPSASAADLNRVQAKGFEVALASYIASCVKSSHCPIGTSPADAEAKLDTWIETVRTKPIRASNGRVLTASLAVQGVAAALYSPQSWSSLTSALTAAFAGSPGELLDLSDEIDGRHADGSYDNLIESNTAINCADRPGLGAGIEPYAKEAALGEQNGPTFGEFIYWGNVACADWPTPPELAPGPVSAPGAPPILVIGTLRDPATPYVWAQALARQLGGPLLSYNGDGHTAFLRSFCVDAAVKSYVVSLKTPAAGATCN